MAVKHRSYQQEALDRALALHQGEIRRQLLVMATGCGKTITFAALPKIFPSLAKHGVLILVHRDELVFQAAAKFKMVNPELSVGIEKAQYRADLSSDVVVASVQTLGHVSMGRLMPILDQMPFGIVIVDEAHHLKRGGQYDRVLNELGIGSLNDGKNPLPDGQERLFWGVTATPNRHDKAGLSAFFEEIVLDFGVKEAIEQGYLTDINHWRIKTGTDISTVGKRAGDFAVGALSEATNVIGRNSVIVSAYLKHSAGKSGIAFCSSVEHAHALAAVFLEAGVPAAAIDGTTPKDQRREILAKHETGEILVVTNFGVLTEGYDGVVHTIMMARPTKSQPLYIQMLGRGLRTIPSDLGNLDTLAERKNAINESVKPACILLDFIDVGHDVITAASLFGLNAEFNSDGERLLGVTVARFNDAVERNPLNAEGIMQSESFQQVEVESEKVNVWSVARSHQSVKEYSDNRWTKLGADAYQLDIPIEGNRIVARLDQDYIGNWGLTIIHPKGNKNGYWEPEKQVKGGSFHSLSSGIGAVDAQISKKYPEVAPLLSTKARWRGGKVSAGQANMLRSYNIPLDGVKTKGEASDLISAAKALGLKQRRGAWNNA